MVVCSLPQQRLLKSDRLMCFTFPTYVSNEGDILWYTSKLQNLRHLTSSLVAMFFVAMSNLTNSLRSKFLIHLKVSFNIDKIA